MKKLFFVLFSLLLYFSSFTQPYQSIFGNENTHWTVTNRGIIPEDAWMDTISTTDIEGEYRILEFRSKWSGMNQIIGKIRTNETNSKLYFVEPDSTTELLIMDLDLEIGDAFNMKTLYDRYKTIYVDSIYLLNGKKHIQFNDWIGLSLPMEDKRVFIEGVGPNWGFESEFIYLTVCKYDDFIKTYSFENEHIIDCRFKYGNIDNYSWKNNIKIYPNPVFDQVVISFPEMLNENTQLSVHNTLGIEVFNTTLFNTETILDLSHLPKSIYFFKFQTPETITTKKIIKF